MAVIALAAAGSAIGGAIGGTVLGVSAAAIGAGIGTAIGSAVDQWILGQFAPTQRIEGRRLDALQITTASEGAVIPRVFGRMRVGGTIIWATDFREESRTTTQGGGGKGGGGGGGTEVTEYFYYASFALALCEGPITGVGRIWADGKLLDREGVTIRMHPGDEDQTPDPLIASLSANAPAYRGTAYLVFEDLPLEKFGNRIPQLSVEVIRPVGDENSLENRLTAITLIPSAGEFVYASEPVRREGDGATVPENVHAEANRANLMVALDQLEAALPNLESVSLVVSWFGDDLRCGDCTLRPGVEIAAKDTAPLVWSVNGVTRGGARLVSQIEGRPVFGGTPSDASVVQAINELKRRGLRVTFYPFIMMDVPAGNTLPDPYSDNAASTGQPVFPWRGRITCSPAAGYAGTVDKTAAAATQVAAFFGSAAVGDFAISGETVGWTGGADWGLRRMILHYAHLCAAAGGVDAFLIGTEMRELTTIRSGAGTYPAVAAFKALAADVRAVLGGGTKLSYAADWSEYFGHHPGDGTGDVFFHLDPLWSDGNIDFIGIDNYMPLADWRDGAGHTDALAGWRDTYDRTYLASNIAGGEGYDWFYASLADREAQIRTPITDGAHGKPWVFRYKDLRNWWSNAHHNRPGGVESGTATGWVPESKPIRFTEFGCPAVDKGANQPNVFFDPKSSESFLPYFSRGWRDDAIQRRYIEATLNYWIESANNPTSSVYGNPMLESAESAAWTWDARPYPAFPALTDIWSDGPNWTFGHWLNGRIGTGELGMIVRELCLRAGLTDTQIDVTALADPVPGFRIDAIESPRASIAQLARFYGFDAVESEGRIRFLPRGAVAVRTIKADDLIAADNPDGEAIEITRAQESELDAALKWRLMRSDEDYDAVAVEAQRRIGALARVGAEEFAIAHIPSVADRQVRRALAESRAARESAVFRLPPSALALDPGDVVALNRDGRLLPFRIGSVADGPGRAIEAVRVDAGAYALAPGAILPATPRTPATFGAPETVFLDLPQLSDAVPAHQPLIAARADPWTPQALWRSAGADDWQFMTRIERPARIGTLVDDLYAGPVSRFDRGNVLTVDLRGGTLHSVTDLALFGGANALALETSLGWEIVQFGLAELVAAGRYRLMRLLRGQRGTEFAMSPITPAGARIVILDDALVPIPASLAELDLPYQWRVGPASRPFTDSAYREIAFAAGGAGLRPFSPVHVRAERLAGGDISIRWIRRSRDTGADAWSGIDVPLAEESEAYEIEVMDGGTVKRMLAATATAVTYTAAQQTADFGAALGPGDPLALRLYQLSARVGRGVPANVTLTL